MTPRFDEENVDSYEALYRPGLVVDSNNPCDGMRDSMRDSADGVLIVRFDDGRQGVILFIGAYR